MAVSPCFNSQFPTVIFWGSDLLMLYNDAYLPIARDKRPAAFAQPAFERWPEILAIIGPMVKEKFSALRKRYWGTDGI